jgi:hydrogenase nickel incorporation protein HypA/HybF
VHELSLVSDLLRQATHVVLDCGADRAVRVGVRLGALSHLSEQHLRDHFDTATVGTVLEGAELVVEVSADPHDEHAQDLILTHVEIADPVDSGR